MRKAHKLAEEHVLDTVVRSLELIEEPLFENNKESSRFVLKKLMLCQETEGRGVVDSLGLLEEPLFENNKESSPFGVVPETPCGCGLSLWIPGWRSRKKPVPVVERNEPVLITSIGFPPPTPSPLRSPKLWGGLGFVALVALIVYIFFTNRRK